MNWLAVLSFLACLLTLSSAVAADDSADWFDRRNIEYLKKSSPEAWSLLQQGERYLAAGQAQKANEAFDQAAVRVPDNALVARHQCEALTVLKQPAAAITACRRAMASTGRSPNEMLALVHALMAAPSVPSSAQLYEAILVTQTLLQLVPNQVFPYVAQCEIAEQQRDWNAMQMCSAQIQHVAPDSKYSRRFQQVLRDSRPNWVIWAIWHVLLIVVAISILNFFRSLLFRSKSRTSAYSLGMSLFIAGSLTAVSAHGQPMAAPKPQSEQPATISSWKIDDTDPESSVPTTQQRDANPLNYGYFIMDLTARAEKAAHTGDHQGAIKYFKALIKAVPNRSIAYSKVCISYTAMNDWKDALEYCRMALGREGVTDLDYLRYAKLTVETKPNFSKADIADLDAIVQHLRSNLTTSPVADEIECELGVRVKDRVRLQRCSQNLAKSAPSDPQTITYEWALAVMRKDYSAASVLLNQLKKTAAKPELIHHMEEITQTVQPLWRRALHKRWALAGVLALALVMGFVTLLLKRNRQTVQTV